MPNRDITTADIDIAPQSVDRERGSTSGIFARPGVSTLCLTLLLAVAILRIVSTYHVFNQTLDEASHVSGGIEWLQEGVYRLETKHTPLARISVALLPYLAGVRGTGATNWYYTYGIFSANGHYWRNLTLARIGVLPYFVLATVVVFLWTKRLFGATAGLLAAAVFTMLPTVLAHSGLATTDIPFTAMFCWALYAFTLWLREPRMRTAVHFGIASGLALCTKFSAVVFLPACGTAIFALYLAAGYRNWRALFRTATVVVLCAFLATWAVYRFSHAPLDQVTHVPDHLAAKIFGPSSRLTGVVHRITSTVPVPAPEIIDGLRSLRDQNREGARAYLFGRISETGFWYFFIASLAVKTPLAVLLLAAGGSIVLLLRYRRSQRDWESPSPLAAAVMIMIVTMPARLNLGVRYVMPMFVFFSILAAVGLAALWQRRDRRMLSRTVAVLLFAWLAVSSARSHPDYLAYFNEFGGSDPSRLLVVSDLDWGQDLTRLATYLHEHHIEHVQIAYEGLYDPDALGLPDTENLPCGATPSGWVAMSVRRVRRFPECFPWVAQQHLIAKVGKTMQIYYVTNP